MLWPASLFHLLGVSEQADVRAIDAAHEAALRALPRSRAGRVVAWLSGRSPAALRHARDVLSDPVARAAYERRLQLNLWLSQAPPGH